MPIWGAAIPSPFAEIIVSSRSFINSCIYSEVISFGLIYSAFLRKIGFPILMIGRTGIQLFYTYYLN
jgi:hypothetical protein